MVDWVYLTMSLLALVAVTAWGWWRECRGRIDAEEVAHRRLAACNEYSIEANELRGERQEWLRERGSLAEELKAALASRDEHRQHLAAAVERRDRLAAEVQTWEVEVDTARGARDHHQRAREQAEAERDRLAAEAQGWPRKEVALTEELLATISARDQQQRAREQAEAERDRLAAEVKAWKAELARRDRTLDAVARALCRPGAEADGARAGKGGDAPVSDDSPAGASWRDGIVTDAECSGKDGPAPELPQVLNDIKVGQTWFCAGPKPTPGPAPAPALVAVLLWRNIGGAGCWRPA